MLFSWHPWRKPKTDEHLSSLYHTLIQGKRKRNHYLRTIIMVKAKNIDVTQVMLVSSRTDLF